MKPRRFRALLVPAAMVVASLAPAAAAHAATRSNTPLRSTVVSKDGRYSCSVTVRSGEFHPGELANPRWTLTNLTSKPFQVRVPAVSMKIRDAGGNLLWSPPQLGYPTGGGTVTLMPGTPRTFGFLIGVKVRWSGPLTVVPRCGGFAAMPHLIVPVTVPVPPASDQAAIDTAVGSAGSPFSYCHPTVGNEVTGAIPTPETSVFQPLTVRCWADIRHEDGFDVVGLNLVSPSTLPTITLAEDGSWPTLPGDKTQPSQAVRWGFVVTDSQAKPYYSTGVIHAPGSNWRKIGWAEYDWPTQAWSPLSVSRGCGFEEMSISFYGDPMGLAWNQRCVATAAPSAPLRRIRNVSP